MTTHPLLQIPHPLVFPAYDVLSATFDNRLALANSIKIGLDFALRSFGIYVSVKYLLSNMSYLLSPLIRDSYRKVNVKL